MPGSSPGPCCAPPGTGTPRDARILPPARLRPGIPSIMISAFPDPALVVQATRDFGVRLFIAKPFDLDYFAEVLRGILFDSR